MSKMFGRALCWVRRDLRLHDHAALAAATASANETVVVFIFDTNILNELKDRSDRRITFIHHSLQEMDRELRARGSQLIVRIGDPHELIPQLAEQLGADAVYTARDYEPYARDRDETVQKSLKAKGCDFLTVRDTVTLEPWEVVSDNGAYRVYSPFMRCWKKNFFAERDAAEHVPNLDRLARDLDRFHEPWGFAEIGFQEAELWLKAGATAGRARAAEFLPKMRAYKEKRDFPAAENTSALSVDLRFGTVSIRELVRLALAEESEGAEKWLNELIWREFYQSVLYHFPQVVETTFQPQYANLEYPGRQEHFEKWCKGQTGYPIVDAAMRCLNATGYMHNRLRMVVASFLTKDLLVDYRWGEAYFAEKLLDFDLASNNGGWQWAASVGADPQPYFRIFNPYLQSAKFDPDGAFIKKWVPELAEMEASAIHDPSSISSMERLAAGVVLGETYPKPMVDHATQRDKAVKLLESARG